jgi:hypothetical protein
MPETTQAAGLRALLTDEIASHVPGASPVAGHHHGMDEVFTYFTRRCDLASNAMRMHPRNSS